MSSSGFFEVMRWTSALASGLPGTIAGSPDSPPFSASCASRSASSA